MHLHTASQYGYLVTIAHHVAFIPVRITEFSDTRLRPRDPLPVPGGFAREQALKGIQAFAHQVKGAAPHSHAIRPDAFREMGRLLTRVKAIAQQRPSSDFTVCVLDKGVGQLWGFCGQWIWDCTARLLIDGGYLTDKRSEDEYMQKYITALC